MPYPISALSNYPIYPLTDYPTNLRPMLEKAHLLKIARTKMPFGKYGGRLLIDLPEEYLLWFQHKGWPQGELGTLLGITLEIKINGLEHVIEPLKEPKV